ncbi:WbqC family protein [Pseudoalteromonas maricaloris]
MKVAIHQPHFFPWLGYLNKMKSADVFVLLDDTQFAKRDWQHRNYIANQGCKSLLTVPLVKSSHTTQLKSKLISYDYNWPQKTWNKIYNNYHRSPYWHLYNDKLHEVLFSMKENFSNLCFDMIEYLRNSFNIKTKILRSSDLGPKNSKKNDLVIEICKVLGAHSYISGLGAKSYIIEENFQQSGITIYWQDYQHPTYVQHDSQDVFRSHLWAIDALMNLGPNARELI